MQTYDDLIERLTRWAKEDANVRAAMILGSRARRDHPADEWSDLDVLVFAGSTEPLIQNSTWAINIAPCWLTYIEHTGDGSSWERRTLYEGGLDVDIALFTVELLDGMLVHGILPNFGDVIRRGVKILVDKDGKLTSLLSLPLPEATIFHKPTPGEFLNQTTDFWYHTLWAAKHLRRGELWWAKSCVDGKLKALLGDMLEWHARATRGERFDTWLRGRFLEEWADPRAVEKLGAVFSHYDTRDIACALRATMDLYRWLEDETATRWEYPCPREGEQEAGEQALVVLEPL